MRSIRFSLLAITAFAICSAGCNGTDQSEQIATDQQLSDYGQASAPREWKEGLEAMKKDGGDKD